MKASATEGEFIPYDARIVGFWYKTENVVDGRFEITRNGAVIKTVDHSIKNEDYVILDVNFAKNGVLAVKDSADSPGLDRTNVKVQYRRIGKYG
jgi:hypothetical protein